MFNKLIRRACVVLGLFALLAASWISIVHRDSPPLFAEMAFLWAIILVLSGSAALLLRWYLKLRSREKGDAPRR